MSEPSGAEALRAVQNVREDLRALRQDVRQLEETKVSKDLYMTVRQNYDLEMKRFRETLESLDTSLGALEDTVTERERARQESELLAAKREKELAEQARMANRRWVISLVVAIPSAMLALTSLIALLASRG